MSDKPAETQEAHGVALTICPPECTCQKVYILFDDGTGHAFASADLDPDEARRMSRGLARLADQVEARKACLNGRLN